MHLGGYEINLDKRKLKTPMGNLFRVPTESLAVAVMTEWHAQQDTIKRHSMHMVTLRLVHVFVRVCDFVVV